VIMTDQKKIIEHLLSCPVCQSSIKMEGECIQCQSCQAFFPVVEGIPIMLPGEKDKASIQQAKAVWDANWQAVEMIDINRIEDDPAYADAMNHIREHAPGKSWDVFFEAGCGDARKSLVLAREKKIQVIGVDTSLSACRRARDLFTQAGLEALFVVGDLRQLPIRASVVDYIYAGGSMEHFPETELAVQEAYRVLTPQGRITSTVPCLSIASLTYAQLWGNIPELPIIRPIAEWFHMRLLKGKHMKYGYEKSFMLNTWKKYFLNVGFKNVRVDLFKTYMGFQFIPWNWLKRIARMLTGFRWFWPVIYVDADR